MKNGTRLGEQLRRVKARLQAGISGPAPTLEKAPLRAELFSAEQMELHGKALAASHRLAPSGRPDELLPRLAANESVLVEVCALLTSAAAEKSRIAPAGDWLLDNFYLIEEQIRTAKRDLPKGYSRELPRLAEGPSAGRPRVYDIALESISHGDGRVDTETLGRFVAAYQRVTALKLGELWAIPIMLRLAVIENLRRVSVRISAGWVERSRAASWADKMMEAVQNDPKSLILVVADMARSNPPLTGPFVAELVRRLQGRGPALALPLSWIEERLSEAGLATIQLVQSESQQQAADQVSVSNSIGSLRVLGAVDWREFVEAMSLVEQTLREDPADAYARMDFATRDLYRHATERIAKLGRLSEGEVARKAVELADAATVDRVGGGDERANHVGYYLIDKGLPALERAAQVRLSGVASLRRAAGRMPLLTYLGSIALLTVGIAAGLLAQVLGAGLAAWVVLPLGILSLLIGSQLAVALVNWLATLLVVPRPLPRMDFGRGIPGHSRTLVVVPTMLASEQGIENLVEALEVRFLANQDESLHFALVSDFLDAQQETMPGDAALVERARARVEELNLKYGRRETQGGSDIFYLFHRPRLWNPQERVWMGYERKRGKLEALNVLLRSDRQGGRPAEDFSLVVGDTAILSTVKYVITLDTDTQLPRDVARQFVGAMAHPLNRPRYDRQKRRVTAGYGILQPRVAVSLPCTNRSLYARLYGGDAGIDPYTRAVSDVYQDVFGEGSFVGKGIYDVDAFEQALGGCLPENRILSHDLIEGCYARSGLLSDVMVYEDFPARYSADVSRRRRWIRGDWQLLGWLSDSVPGVLKGPVDAGMDAHRLLNPLSPLSKWKLIDNLRRSLVPPALTLLLVLGWGLFASPGWWTLSLIGILLLPAICAALLDLLRKPDEVLVRQHFGAVWDTVLRRLVQFGFELACLPYEAFYSLDAVARTVWRTTVSKRRRLEWKPSSEVERELAGRGGELGASLRAMWVAPAIAVTSAMLLASTNPGALLVAAPLLLLWLLSPVIGWWISRPLRHREAILGAEQRRFLHSLARRTWEFFDHFVDADNNWLPPDNYQEYRIASVAHRTSPTNMGLALLANLSAYDFGYIPLGKLVERSTKALHTMDGLERYRGHFYNWYDTRTLTVLPPRYISSVDSGNLAGHLLTLRAGLTVLGDELIFRSKLFDGLGDTLGILVETVGGAAPAGRADSEATVAFQRALASAAATPPGSLEAAHECLLLLKRAAGDLLVATENHPDVLIEGAPAHEAEQWAGALGRQCRAAIDELLLLAPWLLLPPPPPEVEGELGALGALGPVPTMRGLAGLAKALGPAIAQSIASARTPGALAWLTDLQQAIGEGSRRATDMIVAIDRLAVRSGELAYMEYDFLYDKERHLLAIGYNVTERRVDSSFYDLLASEARLCSFVAIAQGQLPQENWFALGRQLTATGGAPVLLSWSGSMFEYLMPLLVMPCYEKSLLDQTCIGAVMRQIEYGRQRGVPWGISESGYNTVDVQLNYQYRAFGVPGLGLKRGLADDLVIAPYASVMALIVAPEAACLNLQRLAAEGFVGRYGFFEAIDYTPVRLRRDHPREIVRAFMAHHQGMSLLALAYRLLDRPMQRRFASDRLFQAVMLLLQERIPRPTALFSHTARLADMHVAESLSAAPIRVFSNPDTPIPEVQLLSNGRYHVMVTNAGGGYSRWNELAVTRWYEDGTCDNRGAFCYVRDVTSGAFWSVAHQPTLRKPSRYEAIFSEGRAEFRRRDALDAVGGAGYGEGEIETYTEIVVSPEDDIELRRVRITNRSRSRREIEVTSYAEVVIAPPATDALHPAFSNLFVHTEILPERGAILCTRRPRSVGERAPWMLHLMVVHGAPCGEVSFETDRARFIGRTRSTVAPQAMTDQAGLSGSDGSVLDPIVAIRNRVMLEPDQAVTVDIVSGMAESRDVAVCLVEKYRDRHLADRVFELTWTHSQVVLQQLNASEADSQLYARLASVVIHADGRLRGEPSVLMKNRRGQSGLWGYAISGDLPIVLLQIMDATHIDLVRQLVQAHAYWRLKGLVVDLVIWNEDHAGYRQQLQEQIMGLIASDVGASVIDRPGGIFVRPAEQISSEDRGLLESVARAVITDSRGTLAEQLDHHRPAEPRIPLLTPASTLPPPALTQRTPEREALILDNGLGGFSADGREYVIRLTPGRVTPAPWVNVLANPHFGSLVSESGSAYTWSENAHEFRITPWHNDPVSDSGGEAFYLRDEESGRFWSPTPLPAGAGESFVIRHGFGYSVFETRVDGICSSLWVYVAADAAVKFSALRIRNESGRPRRLSATGYVEWVLGDLRAKSAMHVSTNIDARSGVLQARNFYNTEFARRVAFFDVDDRARSVTGSRVEFIGRNGTLANPAAMRRERLSGKVGAGLDPCAAIQVGVELAEGEEREVVFRLGVGRNADEARELALRERGAAAARDALEAVQIHWRRTLGAVQVETPDPAVDVLVNGWLVYQIMTCRLWGRSGFYQSGGAFGFRDQLQDVMALVHTQPRLVREQLLLCASRQFEEGDVQHWWHPPSGRGVRTRCSDDYLWLPLVVSRYVLCTGDTGVLDDTASFLQGRPVNPEDDSYYDLPGGSSEVESLYQHCVRAIRHGLQFGRHGLPLIGSGDWNDGMNLVGIKGQGESVWLGFFLCTVLTRFAQVAQMHDDPSFALMCREECGRLQQNIERHAWDGGWYRRAWFDDGTPLGTASSSECRIDSISQSWSVLSGAGDAARCRDAMKAVDEHLVRRADGLIQLLDPPFDTSSLNPGYIRGYVPGVRENGGQYTHAAIWAAMAFAALGEREHAWALTSMINPVNHARTEAQLAVYKIEPYVMAADVYAVAPHTGRGGWSWYTGAAGWMYQLVLESLLGVRREGDRLRLAPCIPADWKGFTIHYRYFETTYRITVSQSPAGAQGAQRPVGLRVDGVVQPGMEIPLVDDRQDHRVELGVVAQ